MLARLPFVLAVLVPLVLLRPKLPGMVEMFIIALVAFGGARLVELALRHRAKDHPERESLVGLGMVGVAVIALGASLAVRFLVLDRPRAAPSAQPSSPGIDPHDDPALHAAPNETIPGSWRALSLGDWRSVGLRADGTACEWNSAPSPSEQGPRVPQPIAGTEGSEAVSNGFAHACALRRGQALCWGWNYDGELGRPPKGTSDRSDAAEVVTMPEGVELTAVSAGAAHTCAIDRSGAVWCWGDNKNGQSGGAAPQHGPERVPGLPVAALAIRAGFNATCALGADRRVYCWGDRELVGNGSAPATFGPEPQPVAGLAGVRQLDLSERGACALDDHDAMWCWGRDIDQAAPTRPVRQPVEGAVAIAVGNHHRCAVLHDRTVQCWGENWYGQLGDRTRVRSDKPVDVRGVSHVTSVAAGANDSCAIQEGGGLVCWGRFDHGTY